MARDKEIFQHLKNISYEKVELEDYSRYDAFMTNRFLSMQYDTTIQANEMNRLHSVQRKFQYLFLMGCIQRKHRFFKYHKKDVDKEYKQKMDAVKEYYGISARVAIEYLKVLKPEVINEIIEYLSLKGGRRRK